MKSFYQQSEKVKSHYEKISKSYNNSWEYSDDFIQFISKNIAQNLELKSTDTLVDIGCGTGIYTKRISALANLNNPTIYVDPSKDMIEQVPLNNKARCLIMSAEEFTKRKDENYNKILMKHMLHFIENRSNLIKDLFNRLPNNGILLLVMMPPVTNHPLFKAAIKRYKDLQPQYKDIITLFENTGFKTSIKLIDYPVTIEKNKYFKMIENYYLTLLSSFNEKEIQAGVNELKIKYKKSKTLNFNERYIFIKGQKA